MTDPIEELATRYRDALALRESEHAEVRESHGFRQEVERLNRVTNGLIEIIRLSWAESSRYMPIVDGLLMYSGTDDSLQSLIAIRELVFGGVHNVARRECRYLLEAATKHLYVDQRLPNVSTTTREDRIRFLATDVPRSSIEPIRELHILLGAGGSEDDFRNDVKGLWSKMAGYIHPSAMQTEEALRRASRGAFIGFEDPKALREIVADIVRAYDLLGVMWLMAAGPSVAGDILVTLDDPGWAFARTKWLPVMSRFFDYKAERADRLQ
ncbi:hypothetical protein [Nocardioides houyundeii]|uniref:hypothetical protein n=1 Tax=Nocardioides houyundeii TaxID=2045452 RepID=UPI000DF334D2|nr:hypothetical protein [Nocardioides houyundeii]